MSKQQEYSAWNPGLSANLPRELSCLETIFQTPNVYTRYDEVQEIAKLTGLKPEHLVGFTSWRLVMHELIVRVSANIHIPEAEHEEDFGINFRRITNDILYQHIAPLYASIEADFQSLSAAIKVEVDRLLAEEVMLEPKAAPIVKKGFWPWGKKQVKKQALLSSEEIQFKAINQLKTTGLAHTDPLIRAVYKSSYQILGSVASTRGLIGNDRVFMSRIICRHALNNFGSFMVGKLIEPAIDSAVASNAYQLLKRVDKPVIISLKGASAAGKSTLRPLLQKTMGQRGIESSLYGIISPDIWRRQLLDYESLGPNYKYSGRFTSNEVNIIDAKLDRYIRRTGQENQSIPNILVDRFRFDSFSTEQVQKVLHGTYAKYAHIMYMYFVITPPEETVERGWIRGQQRGRYKSVEDFLGHSVEAYQGIPKLIFKWLAHTSPRYEFTFFDNSVPKGQFPLTSVTGNQKGIQVFDPMVFVNIERYQKINIYARNLGEVYPSAELMSVANNMNFFNQCLKRFPMASFSLTKGSEPYLIVRQKTYTISHQEEFNLQLEDPQLKLLFEQILGARIYH
tara:strand:- start:2037 stop:3734 length:1698 start_codon:yes stop_codon:yes gene_type:complete